LVLAISVFAVTFKVGGVAVLNALPNPLLVPTAFTLWRFCFLLSVQCCSFVKVVQVGKLIF